MTDIQTLTEQLSNDNIFRAFDCGVVRAYTEDSDKMIQLRFCHPGDPDGENSYFDTDLYWDEWRDEMSDEDCANWVRDFLIGLVEDDPETYGDEVSFYAALVAECE